MAKLKPDSFYVDLVNKHTTKNMVGQKNEIASINSKVASLEKAVLQHTTTLDHVAKKIKQGLQTDKQQKQLTETLQKLETASFNSKTLDRHLYTVLNFLLSSFKHVPPNSNFNQLKHFLKQKAEAGQNELISITKSINLY